MHDIYLYGIQEYISGSIYAYKIYFCSSFVNGVVKYWNLLQKFPMHVIYARYKMCSLTDESVRITISGSMCCSECSLIATKLSITWHLLHDLHFIAYICRQWKLIRKRSTWLEYKIKITTLYMHTNIMIKLLYMYDNKCFKVSQHNY